jgi:hypothetical protein
LYFLWPIRELEVQQWFMHGHQTFLTVLNRSYALIHIPGTVGYAPPFPLNFLVLTIQIHCLVLLQGPVI